MATFKFSNVTVNYFVKLSAIISANDLAYEVMDFIDSDCTEQGQDEFNQDAYDSLMGSIIKKTTKRQVMSVS